MVPPRPWTEGGRSDGCVANPGDRAAARRGADGAAETYPLGETVKAGDCFRIRLEMTLKGEIKVSRDGKPATLPLTAPAATNFPSAS